VQRSFSAGNAGSRPIERIQVALEAAGAAFFETDAGVGVIVKHDGDPGP